LLDAFALLPDVGPAVVLANTALEVRINQVLDETVPSTGVGPALWAWITDRERFWQEPSTADRFDVLLRALTSRSLADEPDLWKAFKNLRAARNSFVHAGELRIGKRATQSVTVEMAQDLLMKAQRILDWLDSVPFLQSTGVRMAFPMRFEFKAPVVKLPIGG
jgi:hypothetical protein